MIEIDTEDVDVLTSKSKKIKVFISGKSGKYGNDTFVNIFKGELSENIENCDVVLFTGGGDISPSLYQHKKNSKTSGVSDVRDNIEVVDFNLALYYKKPMFGICRGLQLLAALSGAKLFQHIELGIDGYFHAGGDHPITTVVGNKKYEVTHAHHQAVNLIGLDHEDYELIAEDERLHRCYSEDPAQFVLKKIPEIVYFKKTNCLGVQFHPEWMVSRFTNPKSMETIQYLRELITNKLNLEICVE